MAGAGTKRIVDLTETSEVQSGDYLAIDSTARGTKKTPVSALATSQALAAEVTARQQADEAEAQARTQAISAEQTAREQAIEAEQTAREEADDALTESVTALSDEVTAQGELIQNPTKTVSGSIAHFTDGAEMPAKSVIVNIEPQQSGTGTPAPDNVRQISGWESVTVADYAVNMVTEQTNEKRPCFIKKGTSIVASVKKDGDGNAYFYYYRADGTQIDYWGLSSTQDGRSFRVINIQEDVYFVAWLSVEGTTITDRQVAVSPTLEYNETLAHVATTTTNLGRTVYGGTLDVVSGVLTAYPFYPSYNGETLNGRWICDRAVYAEGTTPPTGSQVALISGTGTTFQLTPTQINTLLGENNVWADAGAVEVTYRRDINLALEQLEALLNGTETASQTASTAETSEA